MRGFSPSRPHKYRCIAALYPSAIALLFSLTLPLMEHGSCRYSPYGLKEFCMTFPAYIWWSLLSVFCFGLLHFAYRLYRDFYCGDITVVQKKT
jgi:hypothetical protein